ncbi:MAG: M55 family metallopeptidase [Candidatus Bathyarchaeia archaeon]
MRPETGESVKLFIMTDLEGATGVAGTWDDFNPGARQYLAAVRFLTGDVNAAVEGALEAGVETIVVLDGHGAGFSLDLETLRPEAQLIRGRRVSELEGLDASFDLMFCVGAHSMAGTIDGLLSHTLSSASIINIWLNGRPVGEIGLWAAIAGQLGIPVGLVAGDGAALREAKSLLDDIEGVAVKEATSRFAARCLHPSVTGRLIKEASRRAALNRSGRKPYVPATPIQLRVEFTDVQTAERIAKRAGVERIDGRTVSYSCEKVAEALAQVL